MVETYEFTLQINLDDLDKYWEAEKACRLIYEAELLIDIADEHKIELKVFYDTDEDLGNKITRWLDYSKERVLAIFRALEFKDPDYLLDIDFTIYSWQEITTVRNLDSREYLLVKLNGVKLRFKNDKKLESEFYLNHAAFKLIELNYWYSSNAKIQNRPYRWEPLNKVKDYIPFNGIGFMPEFDIFSSNDRKDKITITKIPRIKVSYSNISESEVKKHVALICLLYSFYAGEKVDFNFAKIYTNNSLYVEIKKVEVGLINNEEGIFSWDFHRNPLKLILGVDVPFTLQKLDFLQRIIQRYNYALKTDGESKFMVLYNILEQIRNEYILAGEIETEKAGKVPNLKKVKEEFTFSCSSKAADKLIKEALMKVSEIVIDEQRDDFINGIASKRNTIKLLTMADQFKSLLDYLQLDASLYGLDFTKLLSLRNTIFHGKHVEDVNYLNEINLYKSLPRFTGIVVLRYLGIQKFPEHKSWGDLSWSKPPAS